MFTGGKAAGGFKLTFHHNLLPKLKMKGIIDSFIYSGIYKDLRDPAQWRGVRDPPPKCTEC
jgi:hypothetical protein